MSRAMLGSYYDSAMDFRKGRLYMRNSIKIAMLGGDRRQIAGVRQLSEHYIINVWGIDGAYFENESEVNVFSELSDCLDGVSAAVLPLPASPDSIMLSCPLASERSEQKLMGILKYLSEGCLIVGGKLPERFIKVAEASGYKVVDYFESEEFQIKNAYITAEAALSIAMNTLDKSIKGSRVAITGYGRIAKHLCSLLLSLGAMVTVTARNERELLWAEANGCDILLLDEERRALEALKSGYDVIYNTVPCWLFSRDYLSELDKNTLIVDLASAPGGVDIKAARELGANVNWATSLPGKYAPRSAGALIGECIDSIISREVKL